MSELDSAAVEAAAAVVRELVTNGGVDPFTNAYWIESTREIVTAYVAAAARSTPDAAAMEREFEAALERFEVAVIANHIAHRKDSGQDAKVFEQQLETERAAVEGLYRKAATR